MARFIENEGASVRAGTIDLGVLRGIAFAEELGVDPMGVGYPKP